MEGSLWECDYLSIFLTFNLTQRTGFPNRDWIYYVSSQYMIALRQRSSVGNVNESDISSCRSSPWHLLCILFHAVSIFSNCLVGVELPPPKTLGIRYWTWQSFCQIGSLNQCMEEGYHTYLLIYPILLYGQQLSINYIRAIIRFRLILLTLLTLS